MSLTATNRKFNPRPYHLTTLLCLLFVLLPPCYQLSQILQTSCLQYSKSTCIRCDQITHLFQGNCYANILGCLAYANGNACVNCNSTAFTLVGTTCVRNAGNNDVFDLRLFRGGDSWGSGDPSRPFGEAQFRMSSLEEVRAFVSFRTLDSNMRTGEYSHFINRVSNPIYSVHYYYTQKIRTYSYKILYYGSGGGLMLCIADVNQKNQINLRSFVAISASDIVDFCADYNTDSKCLRCVVNYHLQDGKCYPNFGGCIRYRENLCLQCMDYYFLIQNRCVSDCYSISDARSVLFYGQTRTKSTLETFYSTPISQFYSLSIRQPTTTIVRTVTTNSLSGFLIGAQGPQGLTSNGNNMNQLNTMTVNTVSGGSNTGSLGGPLIITNTTTIRTTTNTTTIATGPTTTNIANIASIATAAGISLPSVLTGTVNQNQDPNCWQYDRDGNCATCAQRYFKNSVGVCQLVDPYCLQFDEVNKVCVFCYPGYTYDLNQRVCKVNA